MSTQGPEKGAPPLDGVQVLLLDDSRTMLGIYRQLLRPAGVAGFAETTDVAEALEECRFRTPDVAVVDYNLGDMTGVEFVQLLRTASDSPAPNLPVVIATAHAEQSVVKEAVAAGADGFVVKPVAAQQLIERIAAAIRKRKGACRAG